jgi:hypothetical protein
MFHDTFFTEGISEDTGGNSLPPQKGIVQNL